MIGTIIGGSNTLNIVFNKIYFKNKIFIIINDE